MIKEKPLAIYRSPSSEVRDTVLHSREPFIASFLGFWKPKLRIYREKSGQPIGNFRGPCLFIGGCLCASEARINSLDNKEIMSIKKGGVISDIEVRRYCSTFPYLTKL
jgi:hypothetical protein